MIASAIVRALGQLGDPRFAGALVKGLAWTVAGLVAATVLVAQGLGRLLPDRISLPWIGPVGWLDEAASGLGVAAVLLASVVLMIPVASAVISLFLDEVADAVEARHYPELPPAPRAPWGVALREGAAFFATMALANLLALAAYLAFAPFAPLIFVAVNGWLLGREYFQLVALRRMAPAEARALRRRHAGTVWAAGALMAAPLLVPVLNLLVPILGAAAFTHLVRSLATTDGPRRRGDRR